VAKPEAAEAKMAVAQLASDHHYHQMLAVFAESAARKRAD
jgi:hypothetical protein